MGHDQGNITLMLNHHHRHHKTQPAFFIQYLPRDFRITKTCNRVEDVRCLSHEEEEELADLLYERKTKLSPRHILDTGYCIQQSQTSIAYRTRISWFFLKYSVIRGQEYNTKAHGNS